MKFFRRAQTHRRRKINALINIGPAIAKKLRKIGIKTVDDLYSLGTVETYRRLRKHYPKSPLPAQFYVFAIEGALLGIPWQNLPNDVKVYLQDKKKDIDAFFKEMKYSK